MKMGLLDNAGLLDRARSLATGKGSAIDSAVLEALQAEYPNIEAQAREAVQVMLDQANQMRDEAFAERDRERQERMRVEAELREALVAKTRLEAQVGGEVARRQSMEAQLQEERVRRREADADLRTLREQGKAKTTLEQDECKPTAYHVDIARGADGLMKSFTMQPMERN